MLMHPNTLGITSRHQGSTRRSTHRRSHRKAGEFTPLGRQPVDIGSLDRFGTKTTQITISLVIDKDQDEVGFGSMGDMSSQKDTAQNRAAQQAMKKRLHYDRWYLNRWIAPILTSMPTRCKCTSFTNPRTFLGTRKREPRAIWIASDSAPLWIPQVNASAYLVHGI